MMVTIHYERHYGRMAKEWTQNNGISHLDEEEVTPGEVALVCC